MGGIFFGSFRIGGRFFYLIRLLFFILSFIGDLEIGVSVFFVCGFGEFRITVVGEVVDKVSIVSLSSF